MITFVSLISSVYLFLRYFFFFTIFFFIQCKIIKPTTAFFFSNIHATRKDADVALSCSVQTPYRVRRLFFIACR